jgi:septum formation protein
VSLVLASRSPARAALLSSAGVTFEMDPAAVDEAALKAHSLQAGEGPARIAEQLAAAKALDVSTRRAGLVLGADQTLELDGALFDKPHDRAEASAQLKALRGRAHKLHSALALAEDGALVWAGVETARLVVRDFSDAFLERYLDAEGEALLGCVGAYRLEGLGAQLFERIEGDYFTVLGLPLLPLLAELRRRGMLEP